MNLQVERSVGIGWAVFLDILKSIISISTYVDECNFSLLY